MRRRPPPPTTIRRRLALYRAGGQDFDMAWERALHGNAVELWHSGPHRQSWIGTIEGCRDAFERAYHREPSTKAMERLASLTDT